MYLAMKHMARYMEISNYLGMKHTARHGRSQDFSKGGGGGGTLGHTEGTHQIVT